MKMPYFTLNDELSYRFGEVSLYTLLDGCVVCLFSTIVGGVAAI